MFHWVLMKDLSVVYDALQTRGYLVWTGNNKKIKIQVFLFKFYQITVV